MYPDSYWFVPPTDWLTGCCIAEESKASTTHCFVHSVNRVVFACYIQCGTKCTFYWWTDWFVRSVASSPHLCGQTFWLEFHIRISKFSGGLCIFFFYQFVCQSICWPEKGQLFENILVHLYIYIYIFYLNLPCAGIEWVHGPDLALGRSFSHPCSRCFGAASPPPPHAYLFVSTLLFGFLAVTL